MNIESIPDLTNDIMMKLLRIKNAMEDEIREGKHNLKFVMTILTKSIAQWNVIPMQIMVRTKFYLIFKIIFIEFSLVAFSTANEVLFCG